MTAALEQSPPGYLQYNTVDRHLSSSSLLHRNQAKVVKMDPPYMFKPKHLQPEESTLGDRMFASLSNLHGLDLSFAPPKIGTARVKDDSANVRFHPSLPVAFLETERNAFKLLLLDSSRPYRREVGSCFFSFAFSKKQGSPLYRKRDPKRPRRLFDVDRKTYRNYYGDIHIVSADWNPSGSLLMVQTTKVDLSYLESCNTPFNELTKYCTKFKKYLHLFELRFVDGIPSAKRLKPRGLKNLKVDFCLAGSQLWLDDRTFLAPGSNGSRSMLSFCFNEDYSEVCERVLAIDCYNPGPGLESNWDSGHSSLFEVDRPHSLRYVGNWTAIPSADESLLQRSFAVVANCPHLHNHDRVVIFTGRFPTSASLRCNIDLPGQVLAMHAENETIDILYSVDSTGWQSEAQRYMVENKLAPSVTCSTRDYTELQILAKQRAPFWANLNRLFSAPERWTYTNFTSSFEQQQERCFYANTCKLFHKEIREEEAAAEVPQQAPPPPAPAEQNGQLAEDHDEGLGEELNEEDLLDAPLDEEEAAALADRLHLSRAALCVITICAKTWKLRHTCL